MQGSLGEKIGEGAFSDVHAWAPGQVLKLFKPGVRQRTISHEARMIRAAFAAGIPAPEVFGEVTLDGRFGIVLTRLDGPTLLHLSRTGAMTPRQVGAILATLATTVHKTPPPAAVLSLHDWMYHSLRGAGDRIPQYIATGILTLIERLPPWDGLCHCDLHPGNVIMTADGPRLVDWVGVVRAPAALDLAVCHVQLSEIVPEFVDDPDRPRAVNAAMQSEYARLAGMSQAALTAAMEPFLPIVRVLALVGDAWSAKREWLIQRVEAALHSENQ
jgi:Ser/Thr protein kinase RdoA (MazF antagonist)